MIAPKYGAWVTQILEVKGLRGLESGHHNQRFSHAQGQCPLRKYVVPQQSDGISVSVLEPGQNSISAGHWGGFP